MTGFLKKLKETAEKGVEKGVELGTKGYDSAMDAAKKGYEKAREEQRPGEPSISRESIEEPIPQNITPPAYENKDLVKESESQTIDPEALMILKLRFAKGEITKEQFEEMKKIL